MAEGYTLDFSNSTSNTQTQTGSTNALTTGAGGSIGAYYGTAGNPFSPQPMPSNDWLYVGIGVLVVLILGFFMLRR